MLERKELATMADSSGCAVGHIANKDQVLEVAPDVLEHADPIQLATTLLPTQAHA